MCSFAPRWRLIPVIVTESDNDFLNIKGITPINPFA